MILYRIGMRNYDVLACDDSSQVLSGVFNSLLDCYAHGDKDAHVFIDDADAYEQIVLMAPLYHAKYACRGHAVWFDPKGTISPMCSVVSSKLNFVLFQGDRVQEQTKLKMILFIRRRVQLSLTVVECEVCFPFSRKYI